MLVHVVECVDIFWHCLEHCTTLEPKSGSRLRLTTNLQARLVSNFVESSEQDARTSPFRMDAVRSILKQSWTIVKM